MKFIYRNCEVEIGIKYKNIIADTDAKGKLVRDSSPSPQ